jgi:septal ring factor EnvC (AmiA/AmiB activator)
MVRRKSFFLIFFLIFFGGITPGFSQTQTTSLKARRQKLEKEISYTNKLLGEVNKSKKNTVYELQLISNRMNMRRRLMAILKKEIASLTDNIAITQISIRDLNNHLDTLKKEYVNIAWYLYKNDNNYNRLIFLFSAKDFNQAYQRLRYLDEISAYIRKEAGRIIILEKQKKDKLDKLNQDKVEKKTLMDSETTQLSQLELEKRQKIRLKQKLAGQEKSLRARLRRKQKESQKLEAQIKRAITISTRKAANTTKPRSLTASERRLSSSFMANKGHLPWPVKTGVISQTFGVHNHPVLKHVKIKNNGVNIATAKGSVARAVFPGIVVNIVRITNTNIAVILKHGNYYTVYSGLDKVLVENNQWVSEYQALGIIHTSLQGKTELHFEVWHDKNLQNPAYWLRRNRR